MGWSAVYNTLNYGPGLPDASDGSNLLDGSWTHIDVGLYMYQSSASLTTNMCGGPGMSGALSAGENRGFSGQGHLVRTSVRARVAVGCNRIPSDMTFRYTAGVAFVEPGSEPPNAAGCAGAATCGPRTWPDDWTLPTDQTASFTVMSGGNGVVAHPHGGHDACTSEARTPRPASQPVALRFSLTPSLACLMRADCAATQTWVPTTCQTQPRRHRRVIRGQCTNRSLSQVWTR